MSPAVHPLAPHLRSLTGRDLAGVLLSIFIVVAPHAARIPWWLTAFTLSLFAWRVGIAARGAPLPPRWILIALAAAATSGIWIEYRTIFGRAPGIVLLAVFSGLKLLESRTHRDATVVAYLCYFLIITNFLYTQTIPTAIGMVAALLVITVTLVGLNAPRRALGTNLRTATLLLAHAAPAALALFLLFPRVQGPLWGLPQDAYAGVTGLSDTMSPGNLAQLAQSDAIAFRAEFQGEPPPTRQRYWRGPVMWDFDGRTWTMGPTLPAVFRPVQGTIRYRYGIVLEPHDRTWLYVLESPSRVPDRTWFTADGRIISRVPVRARLRYDAESIVDATSTADEEPSGLRRALRLPPGSNPRARALAAEWRSASSTDEEIVQRAIAFLLAERIVYTLEPPLLGRDSVDEFLFQTKAGFCEHFSSAFTFLMRAAGIPARVVTGYQGGDINPIDRIVTVRQSDAHAWSEIYLPERGWLRVDPTAAAIPGRVESGLARSVPEGEPLPLMMRARAEWLRALRNNWDALTHRWNIWMLGYNPERQREFMTFIGLRDADWRSLTAALFTVLGSFTVLLVAWSLRNLTRPDPVQRAWLAFCRKLGAKGVARAPHEGPLDYAERAARGLPADEALIRRISRLYIGLRYGSRALAGDAAELQRLIRKIRPT